MKEQGDRGLLEPEKVSEGESYLKVIVAFDRKKLALSKLARREASGIHTLTSISSDSPISCWYLPLAKPNREPEGKGSLLM